jgi:adenosylmethionine-8-amino-7-oxononanoate aminotransferase
VIIRPLGGTIVLMPPLAVSATELDRLVDVTRDAIAETTA